MEQSVTTNHLKSVVLGFMLIACAACGGEGDADSAFMPEAKQSATQDADAPSGDAGADGQEQVEQKQVVQEQSDQDRSPVPESADDPRRRAPDPEVVLARMLHDIWWSAPEIVANLDLAEAQREQMDAELRQYHEEMLARRNENAELLDEYKSLLAAGEWEALKPIIDQLAGNSGSFIRADTALQINVLQILSDEQFNKAQADYPGLTLRQWARGMRVLGYQELTRQKRRERARSD